jgi:hypothetical protein
MALDDLFGIRDYLREEGRVIKDAPVAFASAALVGVCVLGFIAYEYLDHHYAQEAASLHAAIDQLRSANENLQSKIGILETQVRAAPSPSPAPTATIGPTDLKLSVAGGNVFEPDAPDMKGRYAGIALTTRIWNTGTPSIAIDWSLFVIPKGKAPVRAQLTGIPATLSLRGPSGSAVIRAADALDLMTIKNPVQAAVVEGVLLFYAPLQRAIVLDAATELELSVKDAQGMEFKWKQRMGDWIKR